MAFAFDPGLALARARNSAHTPPTVPTAPTVATGGAGTVGGIGTVDCAYAPKAALAVGSIGTVGRAHAFAAPDLDAFEERAAIAEHDGGLPRAEAEQLAVGALGFADQATLYAAAAEGWRRKLKTLALCEPSPRGQDAIAAALRFIADGWAEKAVALGWPELEMFGTDPRAPWERLDRMGAAYSAFTPCAVTAEAIVYRGAGARPMRRWRASQANGARLP